MKKYRIWNELKTLLTYAYACVRNLISINLGMKYNKQSF